MPLITITGFPSSGKTTRTKQLKKMLRRFTVEPVVEIKLENLFESQEVIDPMQRFFNPQSSSVDDSVAEELDENTFGDLSLESIEYKGRRYQIVVLNDESLHIDTKLYENSYSEKQARGLLLSAVERHLTPDTIVICDSLNYIKGFRYQLYCVAKAVGTPWCVLHVATPQYMAKGWNTKYNDDLFENLVFRYEEPIASNRWDAPLFTLVPSKCTYSAELPLNTVDHAPLLNVCDFVFNGEIKNPNFSTVIKPVSDSNYLQLINKTTLKVIKDVLKISNVMPGAEVKLYIDIDTEFIMPLKLSRPKLKDLQRSFVNLRTISGSNLADIRNEDEMNIRRLFLEFLNQSLEHSLED